MSFGCHNGKCCFCHINIHIQILRSFKDTKKGTHRGGIKKVREKNPRKRNIFVNLCSVLLKSVNNEEIIFIRWVVMTFGFTFSSVKSLHRFSHNSAPRGGKKERKTTMQLKIRCNISLMIKSQVAFSKNKRKIYIYEGKRSH